MTILDKLLEVGLKCPCGGKVEIFYPENGVEKDLDIYCETCSANIGPGMSTLDALTAWLVLTGGPVPGKIKPPASVDVLSTDLGDVVVFVNDHWYYALDKVPFRCDNSDRWYFIDRNPDIIRAWLEEEV